MSKEQARAYLKASRDEASKQLGGTIPNAIWNKALIQATRKLRFIISREGDAGGERTKPYYLGTLAREAIEAEAFTEYTKEKSRRLLATTQIQLPKLYTATGNKVNAIAE